MLKKAMLKDSTVCYIKMISCNCKIKVCNKYSNEKRGFLQEYYYKNGLAYKKITVNAGFLMRILLY